MIEVVPLEGIPEVRPGDDLGGLLADAVDRAGGLREDDVLVVSQKVVSKAEGRVEQAVDHVEVILREARAVRRRRDDLIIAETEHGFVCASAGVDRSNTPGDDWVILLPRDPDASARGLREALAARFATEFNIGFRSEDVVAETFDGVRRACEQIGRDPATMRTTVALPTVVATDDADYLRRLAAIGADADTFAEVNIAGTPGAAVEKLLRLRDLGADRVYLQLVDLRDLDHLELSAAAVLPHLRGALPAGESARRP